MHVIEFQGADAKPVGSKAAGNPVAPISEMFEAKTWLVSNRPVLLATGPYVLATAQLIEQDPLLWHEASAGLYRWNQLHADPVQDRHVVGSNDTIRLMLHAKVKDLVQ